MNFEVTEGSLARRLRAIKKLRDEKDVLKGQLTEKEKEIETLTQMAFDEMQYIGVPKMTIQTSDGDNYLAYPIVRNYCRISDQYRFLEWCKNEAVDPLLAYAVNSGKLNSLYKERDEADESLPLGVEPFSKTSLGFRKQK